MNEFFKIKDVDLREYKIEDKINLYFELLDFLNNKNRFKNDEQTKIGTQKCLEKLHYSLLNPITIIPVSKTKIAEFMKNFMANNNPKIEKTIANFDYEKYVQTGFPLKYSRENYLKDLNLILSSCDDIKKQEIYKKLEITPVSSDDKIGYDGVIALNNLDTDDEIEKRVFEISNKFINDNEILTDNFEFNQIINSLIKAVPEFVNIIGKHQHRKQTLDIHSFMVLRNILKNPEYKNQTNKNKIVLKFVALLHDISKKEFIKDSSHPINSSSYAKAIISKLNLNKNYSSQILDESFGAIIKTVTENEQQVLPDTGLSDLKKFAEGLNDKNINDLIKTWKAKKKRY